MNDGEERLGRRQRRNGSPTAPADQKEINMGGKLPRSLEHRMTQLERRGAHRSDKSDKGSAAAEGEARALVALGEIEGGGRDGEVARTLL